MVNKLPVDKIVCVGKNYSEHARELGDAVPEKPVLFLKPPSVLKQCTAWGDTVTAQIPTGRGELHHEIELVLQLGCGGYQLTPAEAANAISAVTVGLDMTLRTEQTQLKKNGHPWTIGKVFVDSAIIGPWLSVKELPDYLDTEFSLTVDNTLRQQGHGSEMTMKPVELLCYISHFFPLCAGDIIFTGTPAGVGPVIPQSKLMLKLGSHSYYVHYTAKE
jgi:2-keto-4-pentenoate hydratase/2-oxohepta-3-ene-1,7-dioic acid hydratase in catechol pathway